MSSQSSAKFSGLVERDGNYCDWIVPGFGELIQSSGLITSPVFEMGNCHKARDWQMQLSLISEQPCNEYYVNCKLRNAKRIEGIVEVTFKIDNSDNSYVNYLFMFEKTKSFSSNSVQLHGTRFISNDYCLRRNIYVTRPFKITFCFNDGNYRPVERNPNDDSESDSDLQANTSAGKNSKLNRRLEVLNDYETLLDNEDFSDFVIEVDGKKLHAHKCILAIKSPVFARMFHNDMLEKKTNTVKIDDIKYETLREMLRFMYTGTINKLNEIAEELFYAADKYEIEPLKNVCVKKFIRNVNADNVIGYIRFADQHNIEKLKDEAIEFIVNNAKDVIDKSEFAELSAEHPVICRIFKAMAVKDK